VEKTNFSALSKMRTFFFQKNPSKKGVRKTKKVSIKKNSKKMKQKMFLKKQNKSSRLRAKYVFRFFKKKIFFSKKRVSKLSVFENGHFWLCQQISITLRTPRPYSTI
jgi:hypothetical protein